MHALKTRAYGIILFLIQYDRVYWHTEETLADTVQCRRLTRGCARMISHTHHFPVAVRRLHCMRSVKKRIGAAKWP